MTAFTPLLWQFIIFFFFFFDDLDRVFTDFGCVCGGLLAMLIQSVEIKGYAENKEVLTLDVCVLILF
jgi:glycopeptide antibiotics resistance protein